MSFTNLEKTDMVFDTGNIQTRYGKSTLKSCLKGYFTMYEPL
jgi:hypothetical protein